MKNLIVTDINPKQGVYASSSLWGLVNPFTIISALVSGSNPIFCAEYSKKRVLIPTEQLHYMRYIGKGETIISEGIAKELGVTVGDKINIRIRICGKLNNDYLKLYEKKPGKFIKYFSEQPDADKKNILRELLDYDKTNEEIVKWLDKNYSCLIREVGLE